MLFRAVIFFLSRFKFKRQEVNKERTHFTEPVCFWSASVPSTTPQGGQNGGSEFRVDMGLRSCRSGGDFVAIFPLNQIAKFLQLALVKY